MRTIDSVLARLPRPEYRPLPAPAYQGADHDLRARVGLAVESMKRHMSDEGWILFAGLEQAGYVLHGHDIGPSLTDVSAILDRERPGVVVVQDQREWDGLTADRSRDPAMRFHDVDALAARPDVFRVGVVKDAQHDPAYNRASAMSFGAHGWLCYYHPRIVNHLAPYTRPQHLIRTYHSVDASLVPPYSERGRQGCLLSGALSVAYPLRVRLARNLGRLPQTDILHHQGYHRRGCCTPEYLRTLCRYKVSICTSSVYGYVLRKLVEGTACGCVVVTDLPTDEVLPEIDPNLVRVPSDISPRAMAGVLARVLAEYDSERQRMYAERACEFYDYRAVGARLAADIEQLRRTYNGGA